jgi:hypothetical protein
MAKIKRQKRKRDYWQMMTAVYFPMQYLLIHIWLFGWVFEPLPLAPKVVTAFRFDEILDALWNFRNVFINGFTFQSTLVLIIFIIPYSVILLWSAKYLMIYLFVLFQLLSFIIIKMRSYRHEKYITLDNVVVVKIGAPGCGKSSSGLYEAVVMARKMWNDLKWKHYCYSRKVKRWKKENNAQKLREWDEIKFSYDFFRTPQKYVVKEKGKEIEKWFMPVPCLLSNIPVMVDGNYTTFVNKEHCEQRIRLPAHCVLFLDEVGAMLTVDTAKQRMSENEEAENAINVSDFFRLCRHFGNWRIICTEQDSENIYIDVRRVVSKNEYMLWQKWVLKPYIFFAVFLPLRSAAIRFQWTSKVFAPPLIFLEKLCRSIGFRKYRFLTENNTQRHSGMQKGKRTFYLPSLLNFKYDERTFRNFYKCKNQQIKPTIFRNLVLEDTAQFKAMFLRSEKKHKSK